MTKLETLARIEHPDVTLATSASVQDGLLTVRVLPTELPAEPWRSEPGKTYDAYFAEPKGARAMCAYSHDDQLVGTTTANIIDRYLDEAYIPHEVLVRPSPTGLIAIGITCELNTVAINTGEEEPHYAYVSTAEFIGSALYAVFHVLRDADPRTIRAVQCSTNEPKPFPV